MRCRVKEKNSVEFSDAVMLMNVVKNIANFSNLTHKEKNNVPSWTGEDGTAIRGIVLRAANVKVKFCNKRICRVTMSSRPDFVLGSQAA